MRIIGVRHKLVTSCDISIVASTYFRYGRTSSRFNKIYKATEAHSSWSNLLFSLAPEGPSCPLKRLSLDSSSGLPVL